jgi:hypothetical protein
VQIANFIEEQRAVVGQFELAAAHGSRAGERAFLMAEQFAFDQFAGNRRAVHLHERAGRKRTRAWMCAASSSLPVPDSPISSTRASDRAAMVACSTARSKAGLAPIIFVPGPTASRRRLFSCFRALFERVLHGNQDAVAAERFFEEIESAGARGFHGVGDGGVAGNHDHRARESRGLQVRAADRCRLRRAAGRRSRNSHAGALGESAHSGGEWTAFT